MKFKMASWLLVCLLVLVNPPEVSRADKTVPPPSREQMAGAWIGFDEDRLNFYRLEFDLGKTGFCSIVFVNEGPDLYRIARWELESRNLILDLVPIDKEAEPISVKGFAESDQLTLEVSSLKNNWKRKLILFNETQINAKNDRNKSRIRKHRTENK